MKREELLAWIGVAIGIPPLIYLMSGGKWATGVFVVLMVAALVTDYFKEKSERSRPTLTLLHVEKTIRIKDAMAHVAEFNGTYTVRANHRATEIVLWHGDGDGSIDHIKINGAAWAPPDDVAKIGNRTRITKRFAPELSPGQTVTLTIAYDQIDGYPGKRQEGVGHKVDFQTESCEVEVLFHPERPCISGVLTRRYLGQHHHFAHPDRQENGLRIWSRKIKHPPFGSEYLIEWTW